MISHSGELGTVPTHAECAAACGPLATAFDETLGGTGGPLQISGKLG